MKRILLTYGGCDVPIDDVRSITNFSSGTFGLEILKELINKTEYHTTVLRHERSDSIYEFRANARNLNEIFNWHGSLYANLGRVYEDTYTTYDEYHKKCVMYAEGIDLVVLASAISDYGVDKQNGKISGDSVNLSLNRLPKVINVLSKKYPETKIVGFKLLPRSAGVEQLENACLKSIEENGCSLVLGNFLEDVKERTGNVLLVSSAKVSVVPFELRTHRLVQHIKGIMAGTL